MPFRQPSMSELRYTVTIKVLTAVRNDKGSWDETESGTDTRVAKIEWMSGEEITNAEHQQAIATRKITMRHYAGLTTRNILRFGSRRFDILGIDNVEERNEWHVLKCKEVV